LTTQKKPRGTAPRLGTHALTLNVLSIDVESSDFTPPPELAAGTGSTDLRAANHLPLILADALPHPRGIVLDESSVYLLVHPPRPAGSGQLLHIDRDSGLMSVLAHLVRPDDLVADKRFVYWTESDAGVVRCLAKRGGDVTDLARGQKQPMRLAVGAAGVFWATRRLEVVRAADAPDAPTAIARFDSEVTGLAVDGDDLLVALDAGELWRVAVNGVARQMYLAGQCFARGFVVDDRRLYWIDDEAGVIKSIGKHGGSPPRRLAEAPAGDGFLVVTADELLWTDADARNIRRLRKDGSRSIAAAGLSVPAEIAAAGEWIAWINRGDGSVMALRP